MKKYTILLLLLMLTLVGVPTFALSVEESVDAGLRDMRVQPKDPADAPKWVEYVPYKYQNPRTDFQKGPAIAELSVGVVLTDLILTAPVGVPMICHSTTKLKNIGWADKKNKYFLGLEEANKITDSTKRAEYYKDLRKECRLTDGKRAKQLRRMKKAQKNAV